MGYFLQIQTLTNNSNFWGISFDAWFTGLTPILIFILGYIINEIIKNNNEKKRLEELEMYFLSLIQILDQPLKKQIEVFIKFSHSLKEKKTQHLILSKVPNFHVEQIKEISSKDLYSIFIKNKKGSISKKTELYGKLRASIDFFDEVKKSGNYYITMFSENYRKYQTELTLSLEKLDITFFRMMAESKAASLEQDPLLNNMSKTRSAWKSIENEGIDYKDMYIAKEMYIEPLRELYNQNIRDARSAIFLKYIMKSIYAFNNIQETKKVCRRHYLIAAKKLQNNWIEINDVLSKFNLMKKQSMFQNLIKIILSILFLLCLLKMPYGYYQFARFIGMLGFALLAYYDYQKNQTINSGAIIYIALALLFQPFIKVALGRSIWNVVDVIVSLGLIISIFIKPKKA